MTSPPTGRATRPRAPLRRRIVLALFAAAATLLLLEVALALLHPLPPPPEKRMHRFLPTWDVGGPPHTMLVDPGPLPGVTPGTIEQAWNRLGFLYPDDRQRRTSGEELRVAAVGGSTTECGALAPEKRWTAVLQELLHARLGRPVTVLNLGVSAQDTRTHLATTAHVVTDLDVDVCIYLIGTNDLGVATCTDLPMLNSDAFVSPRKVSALFKEAWQNTQIARHLDALRGKRPKARTTPYYTEAAAFQASLPLREHDLETTPSGLAHYARNVVSLAGLCKEHGILPLFVTQPWMFPASPTPEELRAFWGCTVGGNRISAANFVALLARVDGQLLATCTEHGYACCDAASALPQGFASFYDQVHFNEAGARALAATLLEAVCALLK